MGTLHSGTSRQGRRINPDRTASLGFGRLHSHPIAELLLLAMLTRRSRSGTYSRSSHYRRSAATPTCVRAVAFSPDGRMLASASADGTLILWRTTPGYSPVHQIRSPSMIVLIGFSPDGTILATSHNDGKVRVRHVASPAQSSVISCDSKLQCSIAFSPDGRTLALSSILSSKILFWDLHEKRFTDSLIGPARSVQSLAYSPDGKVLVATGNTGILHFWNLAADRRGATVRCGKSRVRSAMFSPDGRTLASGDNDHRVRLWDVDKILATASGQ